jgi:hypothetical protein
MFPAIGSFVVYQHLAAVIRDIDGPRVVLQWTDVPWTNNTNLHCMRNMKRGRWSFLGPIAY